MLLRMLQRVRPPHGYLVFGLLLCTLACLPLGVMEAGWLGGADSLLGVALLAAWAGYLAGLTPAPDALVGVFGLLAGAEWAALMLGRLLPGLSALWREMGRGVQWLWAGMRGCWSAELPFLPLVTDTWARAQVLGRQFGAWWQAGLAGAVSRDRVVLLLLAATCTWWLAYFAGWQVARRRSALLALAPAGAALLANTAFSQGAGTGVLRVFLGGAILLMALVYFDHEEAHWVREGIDYSGELRRTAQLVSLGLASALVVAALLVPYVTWRQTVDLFWRYAHGPWVEVTGRLDRLFSGRKPLARSPYRGGDAAGHELAGPADVGGELVFYVSTSDPPPVPPEEEAHLGSSAGNPQHYWRELTYDTYTGRGWANSTLQQVSLEAGERLGTPLGARTALTQTYTLAVPGLALVPAANEPVLVDRACTLSQRAAGDLVGLSLEGREYSVISAIPAPTVAELRGAGEDYPQEITGGYLSLPAIPDRVRDLAASLTAQAETPYDKALAIETYLHALEYDLEIPAPPPGEDVSDYVLFQTRRGYCDYYATAMTVMLRVVGVPARYAAGYAMGRYDYGRGVYVVARRDRHAWTEVYFPQYGWVEFEPTPYRTIFSRPSGRAPGPSSTTTSPGSDASTGKRSLWAGLLAVALAALALGGVYGSALYALRARRRLTTARLAQRLYGRMERWAGWLRLGALPGDTPLEFGERFGQALEARGDWARGAAEETRAVARAYALACYAGRPPSAGDVGRASVAWARLQGKIWRLFIWRR